MVAIYALRNTVSGLNYVGCCGGDLAKRFREHRCLLNAGTHTATRMQSDWNRQGYKHFEILALEELRADATVVDKRVRELYWMQYFATKKLLYNAYQISYQPEEEVRKRGVAAAKITAPARMLKQHKDPVLKARRISGLVSEENRKSRSERMRKLWQDPEFAEARLKDLANGRDRK